MPKRALALLLAMLQVACSTTAPVTRDAPEAPSGKIAIVAAVHTPEVSFDGFARGKADGAARGGGATFAACLSPMGRGCSGAFCGVAILVLVGICGVAGVVGGVVGASAAPSGDSIARS